ncbi:cytochrome P450 [Pisolithus orientalis]|uniref:cytochrome P450 n=1 Tax=Pisolithus orientalis TaxID=936130 RepID=UPI002225A0C3|nr:cytochrome P450 [Pisolithus orientalis]KAI6003546.1 cytochrome P450 [Pisolithus orientalis]
MVKVPPGFIYIARRLHRLVRPLVLVYASSKIWAIVFDKPLPRWLRVSAYLFSIPIAMACSVLYADLRDRREAALRGSVLVPRVQSRWPGGFHILLSLARAFRKGHIGEPFDRYCQEYGPAVNVRFMFENRIFTTEPEHIKAILSTQFNSFEKGPVLRDQLNALLGTGVFNSDGATWKFHRSMTRPFFSKERISHFDTFEKHAENALNQAKARFKEGYPVDFQDMVGRFTLDSATEFLFGKSVRSLSAGLIYPKESLPERNKPYVNHPSNVFVRAFLEAQSQVAFRGRLGSFWHLAEFWSDRVQKEMKDCHKFIDPILKDALEIKGKQSAGQMCAETKGGLEDTLLGHLVNCTEDLTVIRDEIVNILIAARDTVSCLADICICSFQPKLCQTASALTFLVYMLSQHPDVLERLRAEVLSNVGSSRRPTYDDVRDMKYMRAVINETLRLYAPVPFNARTSAEAAVWPGVNGGPPIYIPPNARTPYSVFLMHRREDLWGPDAEIFDPDRFLDERLKYLTSNPFIFLPFNAGPRICLGQQFAYNEMSFFLVRLLQTFSSITLAEDVQTRPHAEWGKGIGRNSQEKVIIRSHLTLYVEDGLWVRMGEVGDADNI